MDQPDSGARWTWGGPRSVDLNCLSEPGPGYREKPYFPGVAQLLEPRITASPQARVLDIGCSTGDFLGYLLRRWPTLRCTGVDLLEPVINGAREHVPAAEFAVADLLDHKTLPVGFDLVTMLGIHSLFDDPACWIDAALCCVRPGGRLVVFGLFNPEAVDVLVRLRDSRDDRADQRAGWQTGWNTWSMRTVERELRNRGLAWTWHRSPPAWPVARWSEDPLHAWTANVDGGRLMVNGGQLLHRHAILCIDC